MTPRVVFQLNDVDDTAIDGNREVVRYNGMYEHKVKMNNENQAYIPRLLYSL